MGVSANYLGHVEIVPTLNQAEYDYLRAFARAAGATGGNQGILRRADPVLPWEPDHPGLDDRPWRRASDRGGPAFTPRRLNSNRCHCLSRLSDVARGRRPDRAKSRVCVLCVYGADEYLPPR